MTNQQLLDYIRKEISLGIAREEITKSLVTQKWSEQDITQGFAAVDTLIAPIPGASRPTVLEMAKPKSIEYFEWLMYVSIGIGAVGSFHKYFQNTLPNETTFSLLISLPVLLFFVSIRAAFVYVAANRRMNWSRILLFVYYVLNLFTLFGVSVLLRIDPQAAITILITFLLETVAFAFAFTPSANRWFEPGSATTTGGITAIGGENTTWTKVIPRSNIGFMIVSLGLFFGIDLPVYLNAPLKSTGYMEWDRTILYPFLVEMIIALGIFCFFFGLENFVLKKRYATTFSKLDTWISILIELRNCLFVLNVIPIVQIIGAVLLPVVGIPFLLTYTLLFSFRYYFSRPKVASIS